MQIQKIFSTHLFICISVRVPGKTYWWWLGRGGRFKTIKQTEDQPSSSLRAKDISLDWLRSRLKGVWLESIHLDVVNGIFKLKSLNEDKEICFGYKNNILNFVDIVRAENEASIFYSHNGKSEVLKGVLEDSFDKTMIDPTEEPLSLNLDWYENIAKKTIKDKSKKITKKIDKIKMDIEKLRLYEKMYDDARDYEKLENLSAYKIEKIKIKFNKSMNSHQKADLIYKKAKAFKAAISLQEKRLEAAMSTITSEQNTEIDTKPFALNWKFSPQKKIITETSNDIKAKYYSNTEYKIAVGLNAKSNDYLRKAWAKKGDIWAHIENVTGAHLIIKSDQIPDLKAWECFASILKDYSNYEGTVISIVWTEIQYVKPVKGKAGLVRFSKEKRLSLNYKQEWMNLLSLRSN